MGIREPRYHRSAAGWDLTDSRADFVYVARQLLTDVKPHMARIAPFVAFALVWALVFLVAFTH